MHLYHLTLQRATGINQSVLGSFTGTKQQEIALSKGKILELVRVDPSSFKLQTMYSTDVFGIIRCMATFRFMGSSKDYLVIGSDSGRVVILEYKNDRNQFEKVHQETFGKSGLRRIVPGQHLCIDPKGRAVMLSAVEKQKLVWVLNRDNENRLTISSPLEAHKSNTFVYHSVGIDVGYENPIFACLEVDYEDADQDPTGEEEKNTKQTLTFYELDLGLNHVVRKYSEPLDDFSNMLVAVPGGTDGPGGVIVCCENYITYKNFGDHPDIKLPIPKRMNDVADPDCTNLIVTSSCHKTKTMFFLFLQTEQGDIFKVTFTFEEDSVSEMKLQYFDTFPVANSINILRTGYLFVASEFGNHQLYQILNLGDETEQVFSSSDFDEDEDDALFFTPRPLKNSAKIDELESLSPIMDMQVAKIMENDSSYQILASCGRGPRSTFRVLRHGLEVAEMAVSELPGTPNSVWSLKKKNTDEFDSYIVVSFTQATLVLTIGETIEEATKSGFLGQTPTIDCFQVGDDSIVQIHPDGMRHIMAGGRVNEWEASDRTDKKEKKGKKYIVKCAVNQRQIIIGLSSKEIVYFEMDEHGNLNEYSERKTMSDAITCMSIGSVPLGEMRAKFLAIGLEDNTVRIVSLDPQDCLNPLSMQALPETPESLCLVEMKGAASGAVRAVHGNIYLNVGLSNGVLLRTLVDPVTGTLSDTRTRYLGSRPVKLFRIQVHGCEAVLAASNRCWLLYHNQNRFQLTPLSYDLLEYASSFVSEQCSEGIVAISNNYLRILTLEKLGAIFNQQVFNLAQTPKKFAVCPSTESRVVTIETDHNVFTNKEKKERKLKMSEDMVQAAESGEEEAAQAMAQAFLETELPEKDFESPKGGPGHWASIIRLMDPLSGQTIDSVELETNESAVSLCVAKFSNHPSPYVLVGVAHGLQLNPRKTNGGAVHTYRIEDDSSKLVLVHVTPVEDVPNALCSFQGRVLVSVGNCIRLYEMGMKKLLKKSENKNIPMHIVSIQAHGDRIYVGDVAESMFFLRFKREDNSMVIFADDTQPRYLTSSCLLDYDSVAVADKFGTFSILRLPPDVDDEVDDDPTGVKSLWDRGWLGGSSQKLLNVANFFVGETITCMQKTTLFPGLLECIVYGTISGSMGVIVPLSSNEDKEFFEHLEMHMRTENAPLCGRDHLSFRSYYVPSKNVIDGDLCEQFNSIEPIKQKEIATEMERDVSDVSKKLEGIRAQYAF